MSDRTPEERREDLVRLYKEVCERCCCGLGATRTKAVFGMGNADADLMFVGEAPGAEEDMQGKPFVGRAGKLLDRLLGEVGMERQRDAFIANVLKCLRYNSKVQLADGSWERISRLVRSRYDGEVMSVASDGRLVPRRVIGWHATPVAGRRVFRLTYKSAERTGNGRVGIEITGDHPVLTERGYVAVQDLERGDRIAVGQGLSPLQRDVLCGTLLGDAHINAASSHVFMGHSTKQRDYALFKARRLRDFAPRVEERRVSAVAGGPRDYCKLHPEVAARLPFDAAAFEPGPQYTLYDEVEAEDVTDRPRADTTFFCIDVEETHNFVTAGGVVHNCRPPGNRDPQPDEIEACRPYLETQIELIEPLVICTLGNFATKLLTGSPVGITRCCGRPQERELGGRPVVIYPLFHPAAALRTPNVLERLREDFARIPALLESERARAGAGPAEPARSSAVPGGPAEPPGPSAAPQGGPAEPQRPSALAAMAASMGSGSAEEPEAPPQLGLFGGG